MSQKKKQVEDMQEKVPLSERERSRDPEEPKPDVKRSQKTKKKEAKAAHASKDLKVNKYAGLTPYPDINNTYGADYHGTDAASMYSCYLSCCGTCCQGLCMACACCRCGPLMEIQQGNIGLVMEFGRFVSKLGPGLHTYNSCTQNIVVVDMRIQTLAIPPQDLITKDNISVRIDSFVLFKVMIPELAMYKLGDYRKFITYTTMGTMKTVIASKTLTELLSEEDEIEERIREIIDEQTDDFGIHVQAIETKRIEVSKSMVQAMATIALSEKQMEGKLVSAKGNYNSARIFREAADELSKNPLSIQLHYFETIKELSHEKCTTILMPDKLIDFLM